MTKAQKRLKREKNKLKNKNIMRQHSKRNENNKGVSKKEDSKPLFEMSPSGLRQTDAQYEVKSKVLKPDAFQKLVNFFKKNK